ncbi:D-serine ammonia-lyase [Halobacillus shinanisalinarum]|uniref:Probable D-serine dehydratase n=1 Tax=Halobacillus shinanisalinarum TaxID=2932258 RepID=A0ABY4H582_9BACI|nr:D-serine ammonia-lyase [Halobacillus shinanisalinarum]UOQ95620.1 D-serine ammonia-lyase [Halobacillus shinanisalinarum]
MKDWVNEFPLLTNVTSLESVFWTNSNYKEMKRVPSLPVNEEDMFEAERLWERFAPFLAKAFPETEMAGGVIESPLKEIPKMKDLIQTYYNKTFEGHLYLKCDNELPIAGSIKARGGVYEVLSYAEKLALENDMISKGDNYQAFLDPTFKQFFNQYTIGVGSTGNLALSIGTISAKLGFNVEVHMSADAKQWKKDLLRVRGANVYEYEGDFSEAITNGRTNTTQDPKGYFVDDEDSKDLFLGYSVAALRLKNQLAKDNISVDQDHPLFVYLPCGVGGSPGGITFGLKQVFGDNVHCIFVEPTHSPSVLLGMMTGENEKISVQDFGIDNRTEADGLAVGRPSRFATEISSHLVSGIYTIEDEELYKLLALLADSENIHVEPSAAAGLLGPMVVQNTSYIGEHDLQTKMSQATHISWATGGALVPETDMEASYQKGKSLLERDK